MPVVVFAAGSTVQAPEAYLYSFLFVSVTGSSEASQVKVTSPIPEPVVWETSHTTGRQEVPRPETASSFRVKSDTPEEPLTMVRPALEPNNDDGVATVAASRSVAGRPSIEKAE